MEPVLLSGDIILTTPYIFNIKHLKLKKDDIVVFKYPLFDNLDKIELNTNFMVKRCFGVPGDSVVIKKAYLRQLIFPDFFPQEDLFPEDSTLNWTLDNYGPLYVPKKGQILNLTERNVCWYESIIFSENRDFELLTDHKYINNNSIRKHTFKNNYYFMIGDNFYNSLDSRYLGFVPDEKIVGKVKMILFSCNPQLKGFRKIRWNRLLKSV